MKLLARACVAVLLSCAVARADDHSSPFAADKWSLELTGSYTTHVHNSREHVDTLTLASGYYLIDKLAIGGRASGLVVDQVGENAEGLALELFFRYHWLTVDRLSLYADIAGGRMWTDTATRPRGTTYNWTGRTGLGAAVRLSQRLNLIGGVRYSHYSNGNEHGRDKNPAYDGLETYLGLMYSF
jgi:hypothetical protein